MPPFDRSKFSAPYRGALAWAFPGVRIIRFRLGRLPSLIPVVLVLGIIGLSWGTTVFGALLPLLSSAPLRAVLGLAVFHPIVAAVIANYLLCVVVDPGSVPDDWRAPPPAPPGGAAGSAAQEGTAVAAGQERDMVVGCVPPSGGGIGGVDEAGEGVHDALLMEDSDSSGGPGTPMTAWDRGADRSGSVTTGTGTVGGSGSGAPFRYVHLVHERNADGAYRYCNKCASFKPDRTHHCRRCGFCVQKMDHDCVFISNCVGAGNHKFFLSFIFWAFVGTLFTTVVAGPAFFRILTGAGGHVGSRRSRHHAVHLLTTAASEVAAAVVRVSTASGGAGGGSGNGGVVVGGPGPPPRADVTALILAGYILNTSFTFALGIFVAMHAYLLSHGRTTIEMYELADEARRASARAYDLGVWPNVVATCGSHWYLWGMPTTLGLPGGGAGAVVWDRRRPTMGV